MNPPHEPTPELREAVRLASALGLPQESIAAVHGIDPKTLRKHYRHELDHGAHLANTQIGGALFQKALGGDTAALIFWCKTRMGWSERMKFSIEDLREVVGGASTDILQELASGDDPPTG